MPRDRNVCKIKVPEIHEIHNDDYSLAMQPVQGFRVHDLVALLNRIILKDPSVGIVSEAYTAKNRLIQCAFEDLRYFQSGDTQKALSVQLGPNRIAYDFGGKLQEALDYILKQYDISATTELRDETAELTEFLRSNASVSFRDASLKNQLIDFRGIPLARGETTASEGRPSDHQLDDDRIAYALLDYLRSSDDVHERIFHVDFESVTTLTLPEDDFVHVLGFEVAGHSVSYIESRVMEICGLSHERYDYVCVFRYLREWARRLFYKRVRPTVFATRYRHETISYNFYRAYESLERIRAEGQREFNQLFKLLNDLRPLQEPWPWQLSNATRPKKT